MPRLRSVLLAGLFVSVTAGLSLAQPAGPPPTPMGLTSTSFTDGGIIPDKYSQVSPSPVSGLGSRRARHRARPERQE